MFSGKKHRSYIISCLFILFAIDVVFVHKMHPMQLAFSVVEAAAWCTRLLMAGCAAIMHRHDAAHGQEMFDRQQACTPCITRSEQTTSRVIEEEVFSSMATVQEITTVHTVTPSVCGGAS